MPLEAADKTIICSAGQASPRIDWCWSLVRYSLMGCIFLRIWLTYTGCQMICKWSKSVVLKLHFDCHYECTMRILNQVYFTKVRIVQVFFLCHMHPWYECCVLSFAYSPLCIHGNSCPNGSATSKVNNDKSYILLTIIIGRHKHQRRSYCNPRRGRIHLWWHPLCLFCEGPQLRSCTFISLWIWYWHCHIVKCACVYHFVTFKDGCWFYLYVI